MRLKRLSVKVLAVSALVAVTSTAAFTSGASSQIDALPEIGLEQLLEIANVDAPPSGVGLQVHVDFPAESPLLLGGVEIYSFTADILPNGGVQMRNASTSQTATGLSPTGECQDPTYLASTVGWRSGAMPIKWRFNKRSAPGYLSDFHTKRAMRKAHQVWPRAHNNCREEGDNAFKFNYRGGTWRHIKYDGVNTIDFGRLGSDALATNYTWYINSRIVEVDMRLNTAYPWVARVKGNNRYVIKNVVAHELGHQLGLEDLSDPHGALTMFSRIYKGETEKTSLGKGDIRGADFVSP